MMKNLIPSKDVRNYMEKNGCTLSDFQKATLIWNSRYSSLEEQLNALNEIAVSTDNVELKQQITERIAYEKDSIEMFKNNDERYIYVVYDEDDCDCGFFTRYESAYRYCSDKGNKYIKKHLLIRDNTIPYVRSSSRLNPYMFPEATVETVEYDGDSFGSITLNEQYEILCVYSKEMSIDREKTVDECNPKRFEFAYTEIPFSLSDFKEGTIVRDLQSERYGVIDTTTEEWENFMNRVHNGLYVDFIDYSLTVYFICESGRWTHAHINPIYLNVESPSESENPEFFKALKAMSQYMSEGQKRPESEQAVIETSLNYAGSLRKEYTTIDEIIFC